MFLKEKMNNNKSYLKSVRLSGLWGKKNIVWNNLNEDVNILIGINGSGKTTLMNLIYSYYTNQKELKKYAADIVCEPQGEVLHAISYIRSYDMPVTDKRKTESPLMQELNKVVIQNKEGLSFFNYRMRMLDFPEQAQTIQNNINELFNVVDNMFADTGKSVSISKGNNSSLVFQQDRDILQMEHLSSGEKQLLLILIKTFLQEKKPSILLMDEPEISLHISWQHKLITAIRKLNPNCQIILTTHSPSIFAKGWGDKVTFIEDLTQ